MLLGKYTHSLDAKNRLVIPSRLAEELDGKITIAPSVTNRCILLYGEEEWRQYYNKINSLPRSQIEDLARYLFSNAMQVTPDAQNRIAVPQDMLDYAGIKKNLITAGVGDFCEIWAQEVYEEEHIGAKPANTLERLKALGL